MSTPVGPRRCATKAPSRYAAKRLADAIESITEPHGHRLCDRGAFKVQLRAGQRFTFTGAEVARRCGLQGSPARSPLPAVGDLSGALVVPPTFIRAAVRGRSWPRSTKLYSWRPQSLTFLDGDVVDLDPIREGLLIVWPMVCTEAHDINRDLSARGLWDLPA